ncbi:MAG: phage terminase small subunit [Cyclobacteriaceae bacterium]|jgi:phage terminase small subunit
MKAGNYLTPKGKTYFKNLEEILKAKGLDDDSYSLNLSMLANEFAKYEECHLGALEREKKGLPGFYNQFDNDTMQVNAFFVMSRGSTAAIERLSAKFGLTPLDQKKIKDMMKEPELENPLTKLQKMMDISSKQ